MLLLSCICKLLSVAFEKVDLTSNTPPFKLKSKNQCFKDLIDILSTQFVKPIQFYSKCLYAAIEFIYKVNLFDTLVIDKFQRTFFQMCSKPEFVCEDLLNFVMSSLAKKQKECPDFNLPHFVLIRVCQLSGYVALRQLEFMDNTVYKELKRRNHLREERKKGTEEGRSNITKKKKRGRKSVQANTASEATLLNSSMVS